MLYGVNKKIPLKPILISSVAAAVITLALLGSVSAFAKSSVRKDGKQNITSRSSLPQGYDYDTVSNKYNLLFGIVSSEGLTELNLVCLDKDKCTLDVLVLSADTEISCDGFCDTLSQAYSAAVFKELVGGALLLHIDDAEFVHSDDLSVMLDILNADTTESLLLRLDELGSLKTCSLLSGVLVNGLWGDLTVSDIIDVAGYIDKIPLKSVNLYYLSQLPDVSALADLLNKHFRVKGSVVGADELGVTV